MVIAGGFGAAGASADPPPPPTPSDTAAAKAFPVSKADLGVLRADRKLLGPLKAARGDQTVFVELTGAGAADAASQARNKGQSKAAQKSAAKAAKAATKTRAGGVLSTAKAKDKSARELYQVSNAVPGLVMTADIDAIRAVAARSDVVSVRRVVPKHVTNAGAAQLTKVLETWQDTGTLGEGVKVGVIDTGIDWTHADFGGTGTAAAYQAALETSDTNTDWLGSLPALAKAKIAGGWDFVGNDYNADPDSSAYQPVPHPDNDPLDCHSHGTHVSGTVGGYGVTAEGTTFQGKYEALTGPDLYAMDIGPGMAPGASLYGLKVFGCDGSTNAVSAALDWSLDPNGDGDFSDKLDIVNLSLGSDYGTVDDPENLVVDKLAEHGVLPVIAMGNNGDLTDTGGSPGNAVRSLAVASSIDPYQLLSGIKVNKPAEVAGLAAGQTSQSFDWSTMPDITADVALLSDDNADGCAPLSPADTAAVKGKIAWLTWDSNDATRRCGSAGRANNVTAAGAVGAILTGDVPVFSAGIAGNNKIPVFQLTLKQTNRLEGAAGAGTLNVTFTKDLLNAVKDVDASIADIPSSFTSRGTHGSIGVVKPDVSAPGDSIASAGMGTGFEVAVMSGTSMATPHTAGIAALVKETHPAWTSEQLKAAIMNTAGHDLWTDGNQSGTKYGPARVGAGRVDALAAVGTSVLAYADAGTGGVSASFGVVEAPANGGTVAKTRTVTLENTGAAATTLALSYDATVTQPGVSYAVSPSSVRLAAGAKAKVTVTMTVNPSALRHTIDPTMEVDQIGVPRQFVSDASGRLLVSGASTQPLRVPVYGAAKPTSATSTTSAKEAGRQFLVTKGTGFNQGTGPSTFRSLMSVMELGATSGQLPACTSTKVTGCTINESATGGDIRHVGANATDDWLWFGVSTWGNNATIGNTTIPYVDFDVDGDKQPDFEVYVQNYPGTDVLLAILVDLHEGAVVDFEPVNFQFGDVDTNVFDTDVVLIPVWREYLNLDASAKRQSISYTVGTFSYYTNNPSGDIDEVGPVTFDMGNPGVGVSSELFLDGPSAIQVTRNAGATAGKGKGKGGGSAKALVFHLHGSSGARAEVVDFK
jgi:subtilisin family serine protease